MNEIDLQRFESIRQSARERQDVQARGVGKQSIEELLNAKKAELFGDSKVANATKKASVDSLQAVNSLRGKQGYFKSTASMATQPAEILQKSAKRSLGNYIDIMG